MSATRTERDAFGSIEVPADRLWGAQTQRSLMLVTALALGHLTAQEFDRWAQPAERVRGGGISGTEK